MFLVEHVNVTDRILLELCWNYNVAHLALMYRDATTRVYSIVTLETLLRVSLFYFLIWYIGNPLYSIFIY